jgi:hypothetical protein
MIPANGMPRDDAFELIAATLLIAKPYLRVKIRKTATRPPTMRNQLSHMI